jgi:cytochrome c-type biogenesis protein CcmE
MSRIDQELAEAVKAGSHEEAAPDSKPGVTKAASKRSKPKRNLGLLLGLVAMTGGITALALSFQESAVYAKSVDQLLANPATGSGRAVRVQGDLVKGTLEHKESPCEYRFRMTKGGRELPVRYANCVIPDTFRDVPNMDVEVTVEGKLAADGSFEASTVMAKCPSKYDMQQKASRGEAAPHGTTDGAMPGAPAAPGAPKPGGSLNNLRD